jgi:hypothetical protein
MTTNFDDDHQQGLHLTDLVCILSTVPLLSLCNYNWIFDFEEQQESFIWHEELMHKVKLWPWPLTLKNNRHLPLTTAIKCSSVQDSGAYGLICILPTRSRQTDRQTDEKIDAVPYTCSTIEWQANIFACKKILIRE